MSTETISNSGEKQNPTRWVKNYLISVQIIEILFLAPWLFLYMMTALLGDMGAPTWAYVVSYTCASYPFFLIVCSILSWVFYKVNKPRAAALVTSLPPLSVVLAALLFLILSPR